MTAPTTHWSTTGQLHAGTVAGCEACGDERHPCGHIAMKRGCGGCDPGAIDYVVTDDGVRRPFDPARDLAGLARETHRTAPRSDSGPESVSLSHRDDDDAAEVGL